MLESRDRKKQEKEKIEESDDHYHVLSSQDDKWFNKFCGFCLYIPYINQEADTEILDFNTHYALTLD